MTLIDANDTVSANTTCCWCGHNPKDAGVEWACCRSCGKAYCTACLEKRRRQATDAGGVAEAIACACCGGVALAAAD